MEVAAWKNILGDMGYEGEPDYISIGNSFDPRELAEFKDRALSRHESFNSRIKIFDCLTTKFRHGVDNHKVAFEAICVIVVYKLENGSPLFDAYPC